MVTLLVNKNPMVHRVTLVKELLLVTDLVSLYSLF
jgi:hypothetical protein